MVERARALYTPSEADLASLWSSAKETPAVDPARRRQLLASAILRPQGGAAAVEAAQNLDDTLNWLDSDLACARARASWREYVSDGAGSSLSALADEPLAMARREFSAVCGRHLLVMHGKVGMKGDNLPGGTLLGSMLMSDRGAALAAPAQQLALAHGMLSSFAPGAAAQPDPAAALEARVRWLGGQLGQVPLVHMLEAGTSALWSALTEQGVSWVARSPGGLRVIQDECPTNLNAVGKSVGYLPVGQPGDMPGLRPVAGGARAAGALGLGHRDRVAGPGRRICDATGVRALDRYGQRRGGGAVLRPDQSAGFAGRCRHGRAVAGAAGRGQGRFPLHGQCLAGLAGRRWRPCAGAPGLDGRPIGRRLLAVGAFAGGGGGQGPLSGVAGVDRVKLTGRMLPVALLKMYAMLEMADGG